VTARLKLLALLTCLLALASAPAAHAGGGMEVAVQDDPLFVNGLHGNLPLGLKLTQGLSGTWIRANVVWSYVVDKDKRKKRAPKNLTYNWTGYDNLVAGAAQQGIRVQLALTGPAPAWATSNHKVGVQKPSAAAFADFARAAALHFRGRVTRYTIWNEPNYVSWLAPLSSGPRLYRGLYSRGYAAIKGADPDADVLFGETSPYAIRRRATAPLAFVRRALCANARYHRARKCAALRTDGFAHHPYDFRHAPGFRYPGADNVTLGTLGRLTSALTKLKKARLLTTPTGGVPFVYLTEYGYFASGKYKLPASTRGRYLVKAFTIAQRNRRVKQLLQYQLVQPGGRDRFFDTSVASRHGGRTSVYKKLAAWAKRAARAGRIARPLPRPGG
jgi:hypothetical protein